MNILFFLLATYNLNGLRSQVDKLVGRIKPSERMEAALDEEAEEVLVDALAELAPEVEEGKEEEAVEVLVDALAELAPEVEEGKEEEAVEPVHPVDLLTLILAYMCEYIGVITKYENKWTISTDPLMVELEPDRGHGLACIQGACILSLN
jgi:hypothetical protein